MILFVPYAPNNIILKLISVGVLSAVKFFLAIPYSYAIGLTFLQTFISTSLGGIAGFFFFYFLSGIIIQYLSNKSVLNRYSKKKKNLNKKVFSRRNKFIIKTKLSYGLLGLVILTPIILSIPIGAFILRKYYRTNKLTIYLMCISILLCGFISSTILYYL